ncbi:MAG: hypothetical protein ACD_40C00138G0001 [uncultured bacterium]|nr:MAG: hypothetical protein ACD_40C00138G0001 [uncultured bacterium]
MMQSGTEQHITNPAPKTDKKKEEDSLEMAQAMQQQMMYIMPAMTVIIALRFPSGLALYWVVTTLFSLVQQYFVSGLGGIITYKNRALALVTKLSK